MFPIPAAPTAQTFATPLLVALHNVTGGESEKTVSIQDALEGLYSLLGLKEDQWGDDSTGRPQARVWALQAFNKYLKGEGLANSSRKGSWHLTPLGLTKAKGFLSVEEAETSSAVVEETNCVVWIPKAKPPEIEDPYLLSIMGKNTPCFKGWDPDHPTCKGCGIQQPCMASALSSLCVPAQTTTTETGSELDMEALLEAIAQESDDIHKTKRPKMHLTVASVASVCGFCSKPIRMGSEIAWVREGEHADVYHPDCFNLLFP